jgi:hypothetical protein
MPANYSGLAIILNNLGLSLYRRFKRKGNMENLNKAILREKQAVKLMPENHPNLILFLNNLGLSFRSRFERIGNIENLEKAVRREK